MPTVAAAVVLLFPIRLVVVVMTVAVTQYDNQVRFSLGRRNEGESTHCEEKSDKVFHVK